MSDSRAFAKTYLAVPDIPRSPHSPFGHDCCYNGGERVEVVEGVVVVEEEKVEARTRPERVLYMRHRKRRKVGGPRIKIGRLDRVTVPKQAAVATLSTVS